MSWGAYLGHSHTLEFGAAQRAELGTRRKEIVFKTGEEMGYIEECEIGRGPAGREGSHGHDGRRGTSRWLIELLAIDGHEDVRLVDESAGQCGSLRSMDVQVVTTP